LISIASEHFSRSRAPNSPLVAAVIDALQAIHRSPGENWPGAFVVEVFRFLAIAGNEEDAERVASCILTWTGLEQTALLESLAAWSIRTPSIASVLSEVVRQRWIELYREQNPQSIDNYPGVAATLLELVARSGSDVVPELRALDAHSLGLRILYQFAQRELAFVPDRVVADLYRTVFQLLIRARQIQSATHVLGYIARRLPDSYEEILRTALSAS
jgi:hypothetical protein